MTATQIITLALAYNAAFPGAAAEIAAGHAELHVSVSGFRGDSLYRFVSTYGVRLADGGFAAASEPEVRIVRRHAHTERMADTARRMAARRMVSNDVELVVVDHG